MRPNLCPTIHAADLSVDVDDAQDYEESRIVLIKGTGQHFIGLAFQSTDEVQEAWDAFQVAFEEAAKALDSIEAERIHERCEREVEEERDYLMAHGPRL